MPPGAGAAGSGAFLHPANVSTAAETASASKRERGFTGWVLHGRRKARVGGQARGLGVGRATFAPRFCRAFAVNCYGGVDDVSVGCAPTGAGSGCAASAIICAATSPIV